MTPDPILTQSLLGIVGVLRTNNKEHAWIGLDNRIGRWPVLDDVMPLDMIPRLQAEDRGRSLILLVHWDWTPERLQSILMIASRHPVLLLVDAPSVFHVFHYMWKNGFDSVLRAGRIRGWLTLQTPRRNCRWCSESLHAPHAVDLQMGNRTIKLNINEAWQRSFRCDACNNLKPWQSFSPDLEWGVMPIGELRNIKQFHDLCVAMLNRCPLPLWVTVYKNLRNGTYEAQWALSYLQALSVILNDISE